MAAVVLIDAYIVLSLASRDFETFSEVSDGLLVTLMSGQNVSSSPVCALPQPWTEPFV
jgi:hypothetical protein